MARGRKRAARQLRGRPRALVSSTTPESAAIAFQVLVAAASDRLRRLDRQQHGRPISGAANIASGFGFLGNRAGFDIAQSLIPYSTGVDLWPRAARRVPQYALVAVLGVDPCHGHRLPRRHRASLRQLAARPRRHRLRRDLPQHPGPPAASLLVQGGPRRPAWPAPGLPSSVRMPISATAVCSCHGDRRAAVRRDRASPFWSRDRPGASILAIWARRRQLATGRIFPTFWTGAGSPPRLAVPRFPDAAARRLHLNFRN